MIHATVTGRIGADAEVKTVGDNTVCNFRVAADHGFGDKKQTNWVRVALWGDRGKKLAEYLRKGDQVVAYGELFTSEYEGKTYLELRATDIDLVGGKRDDSGGRGGRSDDRDRDDRGGRSASRDDDRGRSSGRDDRGGSKSNDW